MKKRYQLFFNDLGKSDLYIAKHYLIKEYAENLFTIENGQISFPQ